MKTLYLADLVDMTEDEIKTHLAENYAGEESGFDYGTITHPDIEKVDKFYPIIMYLLHMNQLEIMGVIHLLGFYCNTKKREITLP